MRFVSSPSFLRASGSMRRGLLALDDDHTVGIAPRRDRRENARQRRPLNGLGDAPEGPRTCITAYKGVVPLDILRCRARRASRDSARRAERLLAEQVDHARRHHELPTRAGRHVAAGHAGPGRRPARHGHARHDRLSPRRASPSMEQRDPPGACAASNARIQPCTRAAARRQRRRGWRPGIRTPGGEPAFRGGELEADATVGKERSTRCLAHGELAEVASQP